MDKIRDLNKSVIVFGHINKVLSDDGDKITEMRTHGKMIPSFEPPSYFSVLLNSEVRMVEGKMEWVFRTVPENPSESIKVPCKFHKDGSISKPLETYEPNDVKAVLGKLINFYKS